MILYHGGTEAVMQPDCKKGRPDLDFGQGFYVTLLLDQAEGFANRKARDRRAKPIISVYEFDYEAAIQDCEYLKFDLYGPIPDLFNVPCLDRSDPGGDRSVFCSVCSDFVDAFLRSTHRLPWVCAL